MTVLIPSVGPGDHGQRREVVSEALFGMLGASGFPELDISQTIRESVCVVGVSMRLRHLCTWISVGGSSELSMQQSGVKPSTNTGRATILTRPPPSFTRNSRLILKEFVVGRSKLIARVSLDLQQLSKVIQEDR